jgi:hypothetical protein
VFRAGDRLPDRTRESGLCPDYRLFSPCVLTHSALPAPGLSPIQYIPVVFQVDNRANSGARVRCEPVVSAHSKKCDHGMMTMVRCYS